MRIWVTRHALTRGIPCVEAHVDGAMARYQLPGAYVPQFAHVEGRDWHKTEEAALARADEMRRERIATLKKSIDKLQKMKIAIKRID